MIGTTTSIYIRTQEIEQNEKILMFFKTEQYIDNGLPNEMLSLQNYVQLLFSSYYLITMVCGTAVKQNMSAVPGFQLDITMVPGSPDQSAAQTLTPINNIAVQSFCVEHSW